jgi:hypothetical protein
MQEGPEHIDRNWVLVFIVLGVIGLGGLAWSTKESGPPPQTGKPAGERWARELGKEVSAVVTEIFLAGFVIRLLLRGHEKRARERATCSDVLHRVRTFLSSLKIAASRMDAHRSQRTWTQELLALTDQRDDLRSMAEVLKHLPLSEQALVLEQAVKRLDALWDEYAAKRTQVAVIQAEFEERQDAIKKDHLRAAEKAAKLEAALDRNWSAIIRVADVTACAFFGKESILELMEDVPNVLQEFVSGTAANPGKPQADTKEHAVAISTDVRGADPAA